MLTPHSIPRDVIARRGMTLVMAAALMPVVIGITALALDGGLMYLQRQQAQSAADAAALAGAYQLYNGSNFSVAQAAAIAMGEKNGFTISSSQVTQPNTGYIAVSVTGSQPRFFSGLWGAGSMSVTAGATARSTTTPYSTAALLVLAAAGTSVTLSGSTQVTASNGSIVVDSTSNASILSSGSPGPSITTPELDLSGHILYSGSNPNRATVTNYGQPRMSDPLANLPAPSASGLTVQSNSAINLTNSSLTLNPGVYNGGINLSGSSSLTLNPGVYYIHGGGIHMSGPSSISGDGVFIYNTGGGTINLSGTGSISLNPMTSGTYAGITMFQDRANGNSFTMSGGSNIDNTGTFYFPSATLNLSGSSGVAVVGSQFIVNKVAFSGTSGIDVDYNSSVASRSSFALVE
jgi:Flp pilus assembly protein TadG